MAKQEIETDKVLDHVYDGIEEYDNPVPGWWNWLFILTILFCIPYVIRYHYAEGRTIWDQYDAEVVAFNELLPELFGELHADEATINELMSNEAAMKAMQSLFKGKCAQCHRADASGDIGPNLTDNYWINVKSLTDIAQIITDGLVDKGMPSWNKELNETQIVLISAYVGQLKNNPVPGKEPQGEEVSDWPDPNPPADEG